MAKRPGLYANIAAKRRRIKAGSGEKMRKAGSKGAPTTGNFKRAADKEEMMARKADKMPARNKKNKPRKQGHMTKAGVAAYERKGGSKLKTAVTGKVKPGSKDAAAQVVLRPFCWSNETNSKESECRLDRR